MQLKPVDQQVVVVMGASSGIGRETARQFARRGAKVVVSARSQEGLQTLVDEIHKEGHEAVAIPADVSDFQQVQAVAEAAVDSFGRLDTWVHLAGTAVFASFEQTTPEEFKRVLEVNLLGQAYGAMAALPQLRRTGRGALIHVSSVEAHRSLPYQSSYAASKHGIEGFLDSLRLELLHDRVPISVTNVMPSTINTPFFDKARTKLGVKLRGVPPYYTPESVAEAILYVAQNPTREMIVGDTGKVLDLLHRLSPQLADTFLMAVAFEGQYTQQPKSADAPDNLYQPISGYDRTEGEYKNLTLPNVTQWLDQNPLAKILAAGALGAAMFLAATRTTRG
ncbi:SDR family oxidoreductase [Anthocerotibacter panamensis]|uniref:SDR family oxidoreductase n=1 Tax=Anthocerotibacter panamensis TaxID=2857077 RepID=UPI001C402C84|nr:SDR family oxidoreductase [Anthocerotibacter panamensis]